MDDLPCRLESRLDGGRRQEILLMEERIRQQIALLIVRDRRYTGSLEDVKSFRRRLDQVLEAAGNILMM